jgi:hypothetical protein
MVRHLWKLCLRQFLDYFHTQRHGNHLYRACHCSIAGYGYCHGNLRYKYL